MRVIISLMLLCFSTQSFADKTMQCERYTVKNGSKYDLTVFTLTLNSNNSTVLYKKISGSEWFLPTNSKMKTIWKAKDNLRVVVQWIESGYGKDESKWSPVYIMDIDFQKPMNKMESYGGFADFDILVSSPWKQECYRLD